ncbi:MAG: hypothetical protein CMN21_00185 [Rubinisphaera sp.]|nr:hypothetical protein [Rubinisphaera sp.]
MRKGSHLEFQIDSVLDAIDGMIKPLVTSSPGSGFASTGVTRFERMAKQKDGEDKRLPFKNSDLITIWPVR